jgi:hypothetical protein
MKGDYIIETGIFDFTAQEVINKDLKSAREEHSGGQEIQPMLKLT